MKKVAYIALICIYCMSAYATGTATTNRSTLGNVQRITLSWTADGTGAASDVVRGESGQLIRTVLDPGDSPNEPDDNYDVTVTDPYSFDLLYNNGANVDSNDTSEIVWPAPFEGTLTWSVANAGSNKTGVIVLYISPAMSMADKVRVWNGTNLLAVTSSGGIAVDATGSSGVSVAVTNTPTVDASGSSRIEVAVTNTPTVDASGSTRLSVAVTNTPTVDASDSSRISAAVTNDVSVLLVNTNGNALTINPETRALVVVQHDVAENLEGNSYIAKGWTDIGNGGNASFAFVATNCGTEDAHVSYKFSFETEMTLVAYKNADITNNGTEIATANLHLNRSTPAACFKMYSTPVYDSVGTPIPWAAKGGSGKQVQGSTASGNQWIFDYDNDSISNVVMIVSNEAAQISWFAYEIIFHEHDDETD